jgi:hypothetical protein
MSALLDDDGYLGPHTGFARRPHDFDDTFADLRHFRFEQINQKIDMGARQDNLRTARLVQDFQNQGSEPIAAAVGFSLGTCSRTGTIPSVCPRLTMMSPRSMRWTIPLRISPLRSMKLAKSHLFRHPFIFLNDNLLSRLGRYPAESRCVHFGAEAVTDFTVRVELAPLFKADLQCRFFTSATSLN